MHNLQNEIPEIRLPDQLKDNLAQLIPIVVESIKRDGSPIETGSINLGSLDAENEKALFFLHWICEINDVIENLNLTLNDMRVLPTHYIMANGSPRTRYYLLVRTFFSEFYRLREIHARFIGAVANRGLITKNQVSTFRNAFHTAFSAAIEFRNKLTHSDAKWTGKQNFNLIYVVSAWEQGFGIKDQKTGQILKIEETLNDICQSTADELRAEGEKVSNVLNRVILATVELVADDSC